jgi:mannan endo-1,4-beta-mannosidase
VTNGATTATSSWTVTLTFANGQRITQVWNARTSSTASPYVLTNEVYNGAIPAGGSVTFGFLGSWTGTNANPSATCTRSP